MSTRMRWPHRRAVGRLDPRATGRRRQTHSSCSRRLRDQRPVTPPYVAADSNRTLARTECCTLYTARAGMSPHNAKT